MSDIYGKDAAFMAVTQQTDPWYDPGSGWVLAPLAPTVSDRQRVEDELARIGQQTLLGSLSDDQIKELLDIIASGQKITPETLEPYVRDPTIGETIKDAVVGVGAGIPNVVAGVLGAPEVTQATYNLPALIEGVLSGVFQYDPSGPNTPIVVGQQGNTTVATTTGIPAIDEIINEAVQKARQEGTAFPNVADIIGIITGRVGDIFSRGEGTTRTSILDDSDETGGVLVGVDPYGTVGPDIDEVSIDETARPDIDEVSIDETATPDEVGVDRVPLPETETSTPPVIVTDYPTPVDETPEPPPDGINGGGSTGAITAGLPAGLRGVREEPGDLVDIDYLYDFSKGLDQPFATTNDKDEDITKGLYIYQEGGQVSNQNEQPIRRPGEYGRTYFDYGTSETPTNTGFVATGRALGGGALNSNAIQIPEYSYLRGLKPEFGGSGTTGVEATAPITGVENEDIVDFLSKQEEQTIDPIDIVGTALIPPSIGTNTRTYTPYELISEDGTYTPQERNIAAEAIISGETTIPLAAARFGVDTGEIIENLLRFGYQTPEQVVELLDYSGGVPELMVELAAQGRTTPEEIVSYFGNNPAYPEYKDITIDAVSDYLRRAGVSGYAAGGMAQGQGYYLGGSTDGMADLIPATIDGTQPAALSDGEFVIPADVVSHLGNGNSDAGAQQLYSMMDRVRKTRTGTTKQSPEINPTKIMPV